MAVLRVPQDYETIQKATDAAKPGDTIVADATYSAQESVTIKTDNLTVGADKAARQITLTLQDSATHLTLSGDAPITAYGSEKGSVIQGNAGDNVIEARSSATDTIDGGDGNDVIVTDNPFFESGGADRLSGGKGDDTFKMGGYSYEGAVIDGGDGVDTLQLGGLTNTVIANVEILDGYGHRGTVAQYQSFEKIIDSSDPTSKINIFIDGAGGKLDFRKSVTDGYSVAVHAESTTSGVTVSGSNNDDYFVGSQYNDVIDGGRGNDIFTASEGTDRLSGNAGDDIFVLDLSSFGRGRIDGGAGTDTVESNVDLLQYTFSNVELLKTIGTSGNIDQFNSFSRIAYANSSPSQISIGLRGEGGFIDFQSKIVDGSSVNVDARSLTSGAAIFGSAANDTIVGSAYDDSIDGGKGADRLSGGQGNDAYLVDSRYDVVFEGPGQGIDTVVAKVSYALQAGQAIEYLVAHTRFSPAAINLTGNEFGQVLQGTFGANVLDGKGGADALVGYNGNDTYIVDNLGDRVFESRGGGKDTVLSSTSYTLQAGQEIETLKLAASTGKAGYTLVGNEFDNTIIGNAGNNTLDGGLGNDLLTGGAGRDTFVFDTTLGANNVDHITDFAHGVDAVRLAKGIFTALGAGHLAEAAFKDLGVAGAKVDADDRILYDHKTGDLSYDADGSGTAFTAVRFAVVDNHDKAHLDYKDILIA
ncbi:calcium-binding protein [Methylorubrum salsuginis]|uniref:Ca2+-binding protein, RTX toxin-related n=1 Tax=Methylorubrum salsuginis TaxID=414703 RepID=A0A1I4LYB1_9HYPH|nr:calcium-binding protein [Methylorubrum salsuginis]SFL95950.1 Ca2+-binding protein, RTX toxin-related [Methylorubrum salsuginis]